MYTPFSPILIPLNYPLIAGSFRVDFRLRRLIVAKYSRGRIIVIKPRICLIWLLLFGYNILVIAWRL